MRKLTLYRVIQGVRTPFTFEVDSRSTIIKEEMNTELMQRISSSASIKQHYVVDEDASESEVDSEGESTEEVKASAGMKLKRGSDGSVTISDVSAYETNMARFFTLMGDNPFPGTDHIRKAYADEVEASGGTKCKACAKGKIIRRYRTVLEQYLNG